MRITEFIYAIIEKFSPMDQTERMKLENQAMSQYKGMLDAAMKKKLSNDEVAASETLNPDEKASLMEPLTLKDRVILAVDSWWFKTLLAMMFVFVVPKIQRYIQNYGRVSPDGDFFDDGLSDDYEE